MLPGPTDSCWSYKPVLDRLPESIRAIAVSLRGHGDSEKPATGYAVTDYAGDVVSFLDALDIERAVLVGHSASCLFARRIAIDSPDRVSGLVLEASPVALRGHAGLESFFRSAISRLRDPIELDFVRSFVVDTSSPRISAADLERFVSECAKVPARVWHETFDGLLRYDDRDSLQHVTQPTMLIWGDDDKVIGRDDQEELLRRVQGSRLRIYAGAGHTPRWEDPTAFANDLEVMAKLVATQRR